MILQPSGVLLGTNKNKTGFKKMAEEADINVAVPEGQETAPVAVEEPAPRPIFSLHGMDNYGFYIVSYKS
jgi:hypothetical protein